MIVLVTTVIVPVTTVIAPSHSQVELVGYAAAFCTTIAFLPQLIRILKLRSAHEISLGMFGLFSLGVFLWILYGLWFGSMPVFASYAVTLLLAVSIVILKLKFDHRDRRLKNTERQP